MKLKKLMKKGIAALLIMGALGTGVVQNVYACDKSPACNATQTITKCGIPVLIPSTHIVTYPNNYKETCFVLTAESTHTKVCAGCGAVISTESSPRTCSITHSDEHCFDKTNMCK